MSNRLLGMKFMQRASGGGSTPSTPNGRSASTSSTPARAPPRSLHHRHDNRIREDVDAAATAADDAAAAPPAAKRMRFSSGSQFADEGQGPYDTGAGAGGPQQGLDDSGDGGSRTTGGGVEYIGRGETRWSLRGAAVSRPQAGPVVSGGVPRRQQQQQQRFVMVDRGVVEEGEGETQVGRMRFGKAPVAARSEVGGSGHKGQEGRDVSDEEDGEEEGEDAAGREYEPEEDVEALIAREAGRRAKMERVEKRRRESEKTRALSRDRRGRDVKLNGISSGGGGGGGGRRDQGQKRKSMP